MKKIYPVLTLMTVLTVLPAIGATNNRAEFFKNFANCQPTSYTANFDDGSQIQRSVIGAGSVKGIYACQYKEVYSNGKTLNCAIPMQNLKSTAGAINSGSHEALFEDYVENGVCELSE